MRITWPRIAAILTAFLLLMSFVGSSVAFVEEWRWWAKREHVVTIATVSFSTAHARLMDSLIKIQIEIRICERDPVCGKDTLLSLRQSEAFIKQEIEKLKKQEAEIK